MSLRSLVRSAIAGTATVALAAGAAGAQAVNYTTTGMFTSPFAGCTGTAICSGGATGFNLAFTGATGTNLGTPTTATLGSFLLTGPATGSVTAPAGIIFTLMINQSTPTGGTGDFVGSITGTVETSTVSGNRSQLVFRPQQFVNIGPVNYEFIFDTTQPANGTGRNIAINATTTLEARITNTAVPEPATVVLMGSGLAALGFFGARRKKN